MRTIRNLFRFTAAVVLALAVAQPAAAEPAADWTRGYEPCVSEDAAGPCFWDAETRGNGIGRSFLVEPAGDPAENDDDLIVYVDR